MKKLVRNLITAVVATTLCLTGCGFAGTADKNTDSSQSTQKSAQESTQTASGSSIRKSLSGKHHIKNIVKDYGTIEAELDADEAPITVTNFAKLVQKGFYDGLTFHRIISGFMIQGGDPEGTGMGGSDETIKGEFTSNGLQNSIKHTRGTISMARAQDPDSASSQFFIMHQDADYLDGEYAGFGHVTSGMEIVDQICEKTPVTDSNGTVDKANQPVIEKIEWVD